MDAANRRILVINPNSSAAVTGAIDAAVAKLRFQGGPDIIVGQLEGGPPGIASQADVEQVVRPLCDMVRRDPADAFVIACFSDPGLYAAREAAGGRPVMGIAEWGLLRALTLGERFGIIAITPASVSRQQRMVRLIGLQGRYAGSRSTGLNAGATTEGAAFERLQRAGEWLRDERDAGVVVLGCAGMAAHRRRLEQVLGLPVVEPCQAAVTAAIGAACLADA